MNHTLHDHDDQMEIVDPVQARLAFDAAVDQLCAPGIGTITRENGTRERALIPCLLDQLVQATEPGSERTGATGTGSRPPASLNALELVAEIGTEMRRQLAAHGHHPRHHRPTYALSNQVRLWSSHAEHWQLEDPDYLAHAADQTQRWVTAARAIVEPQPRYRLRGRACPTCRETTVLIWSDTEADWVRQPALWIDTDRIEAACAACDMRWPLDHWERLGQLLDQQRKPVLALDCE
ncbi:hypothetical protein JOD54_001956 [Actinokineospora baliensis]|uniref:DUF7341 domain-containing protein n=1 Tax=Actinokineospora baliensis TaxID=547056 RepID=UPI00195D3037|nr:hypothetical protein [Actinokineospora baliensis]MBM7771752.1 hypothetical protein [Actinokineospora baliensis]